MYLADILQRSTVTKVSLLFLHAVSVVVDLVSAVEPHEVRVGLAAALLQVDELVRAVVAPVQIDPRRVHLLLRGDHLWKIEKFETISQFHSLN